MKVFVMTYFSKAALDISLGMLKKVSKIDDENIVILSLNAGKEVEEYLTEQNSYKYILADENDSYGMVLNTAIGEFVEEGENVAIINEGISCFSDSFELAEKYIVDEKAGAVVFTKKTSKNTFIM